jgi:xanthine dehydrogenase YagR molybdenum-binding subunit
LQTEQIAARADRSKDYSVAGEGNFGFESSYGGVQFAEVAVDTETGVIKVERVVAVHDCGRPINPLAIESQINGGVLQGISYALYEDRVLDSRHGRDGQREPRAVQDRRLARDAEDEAIIIEEYVGRSSTDAGGIGEPSTIPTAAAVANAVYNATGVRMRELPMTPARVLAALDGRAKGGAA